MDDVYGYGQQQSRRNKRKDDRHDDEDIDTRLADGFDLMSDDDNETISPAARAMITFKDDEHETTD